MTLTRIFQLSLFFLLAGCSTSPRLTIPDPLPEAMAWARPGPEGTGKFLGLKTAENDSGSLDALFFEPGVRVTRVTEDSPASRAGIALGDVVLEWNGTEVNDPVALDVVVQQSPLDTEVLAMIRRDDTVFQVPVQLRSTAVGTRTEVEAVYLRDPARSVAGWADGRGGAVLVASKDEAPFPSAGVNVGSVVRELNGVAMHSARELIRTLQALPPGESVEVVFEERGGGFGEATVTLLDGGSVVTGLMIPIVFNYTDDLQRDSTEFVLIDLYVISLFRYTRTGAEREYRILRWIQFSSGSGELSE